MCFSAEASFTASGILLFTGGACLSKTTDSSQRMLAATPLLFSAQQLCEGLLWLDIDQKIPTYVFVTFGQSLWPIWVPVANLLLEKDLNRRKILKVMVAIGILISTYLFLQTSSENIDARVSGHHIQYIFNHPSYVNHLTLLYLIPTVFSHFVSSIKKLNQLGVMTLASFVITKLFFFDLVFSIWCYFAAILSMFIYITVESMNQKKLEPKTI